jgi:cation transport regulator ChaB
LPKHAQHIFTKVHASAIDQSSIWPKDDGVRVSAGEVAHKASWAAFKNKYIKKGDNLGKKSMKSLMSRADYFMLISQ